MSYGVRSSVVFAALGLVGLGFPASSSATTRRRWNRGCFTWRACGSSGK